jgi:hypothetical protein
VTYDMTFGSRQRRPRPHRLRAMTAPDDTARTWRELAAALTDAADEERLS